MKTTVIATSLSAASAEEIVGRIGALDDTGHRITLTDGRTYTLAAIPGAPYFAGFDPDLRVGEKVRLFENGGVVTGFYPE